MLLKRPLSRDLDCRGAHAPRNDGDLVACSPTINGMRCHFKYKACKKSHPCFYTLRIKFKFFLHFFTFKPSMATLFLSPSLKYKQHVPRTISKLPPCFAILYYGFGRSPTAMALDGGNRIDGPGERTAVLPATFRTPYRAQFVILVKI